MDNAKEELELIAVSKRPTRLLPHGTVVRTNLEPSVQEATPLKKIWCVKLMDDAHAPETMSGQLNVVKTYLKARYRLSDLLRAQRNERMTSNLKRWVENGAPDKRDLEEDNHKILLETRQSKKGKNKKKYNPYGEDFIKDRIVLSDMMESLMGLDEIAVPREIDLVNDMDWERINDRSKPEIEFDSEVEQNHEHEITNFRVLEWLHDLPADPKETILTIQDVNKGGIKYVSHENTESNWVAPDGPLRVPQSNLDLLDFGPSTGNSMEIFVRGVAVGLTNTEKLIIKKLKLARETGELETEGENAKNYLSDGFLNLILTY